MHPVSNEPAITVQLDDLAELREIEIIMIALQEPSMADLLRPMGFA